MTRTVTEDDVKEYRATSTVGLVEIRIPVGTGKYRLNYVQLYTSSKHAIAGYIAFRYPTAIGGQQTQQMLGGYFSKRIPLNVRMQEVAGPGWIYALVTLDTGETATMEVSYRRIYE